MKPFEVTEKGTFALKWGPPGKIEFTKTISGGKLKVSPRIQYFGSAGEEYCGFVPNDPLPLVEVYEEGKNGKPQKMLGSARMPCG